ncbi:MAG: hypothetical protein HKO66_13595 [Saprospiraceae bacterium]|nr:hypothetical protein [Bacteroidia bacterium]NNE14726.1 hypothetical protein [Saprospiraceae bacterium]NNL93269.1 hypothetical protein [Saprospiraceae bacterium]
MRTFKLILYFLLVSNGVSHFDTIMEQANDTDVQKVFDVEHSGEGHSDDATTSNNPIKERKAKRSSSKKLLGFADINDCEGNFDCFLVKNAVGKITSEDNIAKLDRSFCRFVMYSKTSSPDDTTPSFA